MSVGREVYLGDGAYARFTGFEVTVYTTDGITETNTVVLEPYACLVLIEFLKQCGIPAEGRR